MSEFEVILSSRYDKEYFKNNNGIEFSNVISEYLSRGSGIACFISVRKIVVTQSKLCKFLVLLQGSPVKEFEGSLLPIISTCHTPSWSKGDSRVFILSKEEYIPFSLGRESEWRVKIKPWLNDTQEGDLTITNCIIHLNVKLTLVENMTFIHNTLHLKMKRDSDSEYYISHPLSYPLNVRDGDKIGLYSISGVRIKTSNNNIREGFNNIEITYHSNNMDKVISVSVEIKPAVYPTMDALLKVINEEMRNIFMKRS